MRKKARAKTCGCWSEIARPIRTKKSLSRTPVTCHFKYNIGTSYKNAVHRVLVRFLIE